MTALLAMDRSYLLAMPAAAFLVMLGLMGLEAWWRRRHRLARRALVAAGRVRLAGGGSTSLPSGLAGVLRSLAAPILPVISTKDQLKAKVLLAQAGFAGSQAVPTYVGAKIVALVIGALLALAIVTLRNGADGSFWRIGAPLAGGIAATMLLEFTVHQLGKRRRERIRVSLPDMIDLMIIAANAGQSLDVALTRVGGELGRNAPQLAEELLITISELQVLPDRATALRNLAERTGLREMRSLTVALIQTIRYGTPLTQALRVLAAEMRQARVLALEEKAAKLPALLSLPLMLLIMPAVFIVTAGPAVLGLFDAFLN